MSDREFDYYTPDELNAERSLLSELALANVRMRAVIARASVRMGDRDALDHLADMMRTRIVPGADPRAMWSGSLTKTDPTIYRDEPHAPKWCEVGPPDRPDLAWINGAWNARGRRLSSRARYVPCDVLRWRDPEHRAELIARARAHAAIVPGNRATMPKERPCAA